MSSIRKQRARHNFFRNINIITSNHSRKFTIKSVKGADIWHTIYGMSRKYMYHADMENDCINKTVKKFSKNKKSNKNARTVTK